MQPDAAPSPEYIDRPIVDRYADGPSGLWTGLRWGCFALAALFSAFVGCVLVVIVLFMAGILDLADFGGGAPQLPAFGRPSNTHQLEDEGAFCSQGAPWCRSLAFGSHSPFADTLAELRISYERHNWEVTSKPGDAELTVRSPSKSTCISYEDIKAKGGPLPTYLPANWKDYEVLVYVLMAPCYSGLAGPVQ